MEKNGADAFVYSRACGIYARSYVGARAKKLFEAKRLQELWSLLYGGEVPLVPEGMLALLIERKASEKFVACFRELLSYYDKPDPVSRVLLTLYDFNNLKTIASSLSLGHKDAPYMVDIGEYSILKKDAWPSVAEMTKDGPLSWYDHVPEEAEQLDLENRLDHQYYQELWNAVCSLDRKDRESTEQLIRQEIVLQNIVWAMRLSVYYGKAAADIIPLLSEGPLSQGARDILAKPVDSWSEWAAWKYRWLLNPHEEGSPWTLDPRWAQLAADKYLYRLALKQFHLNPFTPGVLVAFFKIKQLEEQMIRVATEGLRLGSTESQMKEFMGDVQYV